MKRNGLDRIVGPVGMLLSLLMVLVFVLSLTVQDKQSNAEFTDVSAAVLETLDVSEMQGYHAVRTNNGCCATSANWLHYILDGDYEEIGFYSYYGLGGGHVFNYIKHNGWYYFADLTSWPAGNINVNAIESGNINDFYNSDIIGGNILKAASLEDFADYILEVANDPPGLIYVRQTDNVSHSATLWLMDGQELVFPDDVDVTVLYDDPDDPIAYRTLPAPQRSNNWARYEDFRFDQMQFQ